MIFFLNNENNNYAQDQAEAASATKGPHSEEETPWTALASVALFKMFNDWQVKLWVLFLNPDWMVAKIK